MNTTITNNGLPKLQPSSSKAAGKADGNSSASASAAIDGGATSANGIDQLKLTDSARALQEASRQGDASPIDGNRVEQVRRALADGSYKIDAGRIADRLLAMDNQLGGIGKA
ncbi:flagellar biosynthesis anti-sigma factor FlgM [Rhodanobacter sp. AS-Z3]|uniref:flagellar biosynthesis anti-sigma factor FlgM n=1 Tax=Rhodanobacter sp. AS-Z3 TaxID=3031330 RepID=UPI0024797E39|nr:flagellar biosynthesis anti-sigma factor FlgM [Rhodanobacter sp. AS-Z3]WEN14633.1 flagellar biosynthesis anti-sigma factor FlgM [Rhodanobacter sp. AS-Z3]